MRKILIILGLVLALILSVFLYKWVSGITKNNNTDEEISVQSQNQTPIEIGAEAPARGIKRIQEMADESNKKLVEFGDLVYLGGSWGLLVGSKKDENFQQYLTQERVQNVEIKGDFLHYQELNPADGNWEHNSINLKAYEDFLNKPKQ